MNYSKYIPDGQEIQSIIHSHWINVIDTYVIWMTFGALVPSFFVLSIWAPQRPHSIYCPGSIAILRISQDSLWTL